MTICVSVCVCRSIIEALITQVMELSNMMEENMLAGNLIDGMEPNEVEDSNDGA